MWSNFMTFATHYDVASAAVSALLCGCLVFVLWCRKVMATAAPIWGVLHMWAQPEDNAHNDNAHEASTRCPQLNKWLTSTFTWDVEISDDRLKCTMVPPTHMLFELTCTSPAPQPRPTNAVSRISVKPSRTKTPTEIDKCFSRG